MAKSPRSLGDKSALYSETFKALWREYRAARMWHDQLKAQIGPAWDRQMAAEEKLVEALIDAGSTTFEIDDFKPYLREETNLSVTQENEGQVVTWLVASGENPRDFTMTKLDGNAVKRFIRSQLTEGSDPDSYPDFLKLKVRQRLSVRGWDKEQDSKNGD